MADPNHGKITDDAILMVAQQHPNLSNNQIAHKVTELGVVTHPQSANRRFRKSDYLKRDLEEVKAHIRENGTRRIVPLAMKIHEKVLNNKNIPDEDKLPWVKQAQKLEYGDDHNKGVNVQQMNVAQLQVYQTLVADGLPD